MNIFKKIAAGAFICSALCVGLALTVLAGNTAIAGGSGINVRISAGADVEIIGTLEPNSPVSVLDTDGEWFRITYGGASAYVDVDDLIIVAAEALVNGSGVNVRSAASVNSAILARLNLGDVVLVDAQSGDFYRIAYGNSVAYIHKDFVIGSLLAYVTGSPAESPAARSAGIENTYASVTSDNGVNLRIAPGTEFDVICVIPYQHNVDILALEGDWLYVRYNGFTGYVKSEFLQIRVGEAPSNAMSSQIVEFALQYLGTPYQWAGTTLGKGVDCSGFVYAVYKSFGIGLNRTSRDMIYNGTQIGKSELQPGDLVFFDTSGANNGAISHVGLYIGGGEFVHSSSNTKQYCVVISSLAEQYYINTYVGACRVLK